LAFRGSVGPPQKPASVAPNPGLTAHLDLGQPKGASLRGCCSRYKPCTRQTIPNQSGHRAGTTWAPQGKTPAVEATGRRFALNMLSAVSADGRFRFMVHEGSATAKTFLEFLKRLVHDARRPVLLIVDGHEIHKAKMVKDYVAAQNGRLKLFPLPPYSPRLNPDEQVWGNVKARVAKRTVTSEDDLKAKVISALRRLQKLKAVIQGFFRHPHCRHIGHAEWAA
jgi:transposase